MSAESDARCTSPRESFPIKCAGHKGYHDCVLAPRRELSIARPRLDSSFCGTSSTRSMIAVIHPDTFSALNTRINPSEIAGAAHLGIAERTELGIHVEQRTASFTGKRKQDPNTEAKTKERKMLSAFTAVRPTSC